jgi:hypothetical protein
MKNFILALLLAGSSTAFAGNYSFECSNADGSIRITDQGQSVQFGERKDSLYLNLKGLELWMQLDRKDALVEVTAIGKRHVLERYKSRTCRGIHHIVFAQEMSFRGIKPASGIAIDSVQMVCEEVAVSAPDREECD